MAEVEKDDVALETVQKDLRLEYDVQDDLGGAQVYDRQDNPTEFWHSQPGAREDVESGRMAAREDLLDESEVRVRYGVTHGS